MSKLIRLRDQDGNYLEPIAPVIQLGATYINNAIVDETEFNRRIIMRVGNILIMRFNFYVVAPKSMSDFVSIGKIDLPSGSQIYGALATVSSQSNNGTITYNVLNDGTIKVYNGSGVAFSGWCRAMLTTAFVL